MPIFEYHCNDCGSDFEKLVMGNKPVECPSCGNTEVEKQFSTFASVIAGGGKSSGSGSSGGSCKASPSKCKSCH